MRGAAKFCRSLDTEVGFPDPQESICAVPQLLRLRRRCVFFGGTVLVLQEVHVCMEHLPITKHVYKHLLLVKDACVRMGV